VKNENENKKGRCANSDPQKNLTTKRILPAESASVNRNPPGRAYPKTPSGYSAHSPQDLRPGYAGQEHEISH